MQLVVVGTLRLLSDIAAVATRARVAVGNIGSGALLEDRCIVAEFLRDLEAS